MKYFFLALAIVCLSAPAASAKKTCTFTLTGHTKNFTKPSYVKEICRRLQGLTWSCDNVSKTLAPNKTHTLTYTKPIKCGRKRDWKIKIQNSAGLTFYAYPIKGQNPAKAHVKFGDLKRSANPKKK